MRAIFLLGLLGFIIGSSNATMAVADGLSCTLEAEEGFVQRLLWPAAVKFLREGKVVAEGDNRNHRIGFSDYPLNSRHETWRGMRTVEYELTADIDGELNYVFYSFHGVQANGTIVLRTIQNKTAINLYYVDPVVGDRWLSLVYFDPQTISTVFMDLSCLLDQGKLAE